MSATSAPRAANGATALKIGGLAQQTGTTTPTIRYYESIGLVPTAVRQDGGQRRYGTADVERLLFIRRCREFGFSVEMVRELLAVVEDQTRDCTEVRDLAQGHLDSVRAKLAELRALGRDMLAFVRRCETACLGGPGPSCVPLSELSRRPTAASATRATRATREQRA